MLKISARRMTPSQVSAELGAALRRYSVPKCPEYAQNAPRNPDFAMPWRYSINLGRTTLKKPEVARNSQNFIR